MYAHTHIHTRANARLYITIAVYSEAFDFSLIFQGRGTDLAGISILT